MIKIKNDIYLFKDISNLRNVGKKNHAKLSKSYGNRYIDLVQILPYRVIDRSLDKKIDDDVEKSIHSLLVTIYKKNISYRSRIKSIFAVNAYDQKIEVRYFNIRSIRFFDKFKIGERYFISGTFTRDGNKYIIAHPDVFDLYTDDIISKINNNRYERIYPLTEGVNNKFISNLINEILDNIDQNMINNHVEWIDKDFLQKHSFADFYTSLKSIHQSDDQDILDQNNKARQRIAFEAFFSFFYLLYLSKIEKKITRTDVIKIDVNLQNEFISKLPFTLTNDQKKVISEINNDLRLNNNMNRLLIGDVGSGKTIIAFIAALNFHENQIALIAPTEILAKQHYENIIKFDNLNIFKTCLLVGSDKAKEKLQKWDEIKNGKFNFIIGTHSLFQKKSDFKDLKFLIIDEQHKFGVEQRQILEKRFKCHVLTMSATPIPRSLQLVKYGDTDISIIKEKPKNRQEIKTSIVKMNKLPELISSLYKEIENNNQIYWVCPLVNPSENLPYKAAEERYKNLQTIFKDKVGILHGQMSKAEQKEAMLNFQNKKTFILVATTIIEVGIDIKDATIIIIEDSIKLGLSQLHQLRGRVGRGEKQSYCIALYNDNISEKAIERLSYFRNSSDGFDLAEKDLLQRGAGNLLGYEQSGHKKIPFTDFSYNTGVENLAIEYLNNLLKKKDSSFVDKIHNSPVFLAIYDKLDEINAKDEKN